jgi:hypothetical protein
LALYIVDRMKDMIVSGGESVYSAHAVVVLKPGAGTTPEELQARARAVN